MKKLWEQICNLDYMKLLRYRTILWNYTGIHSYCHERLVQRARKKTETECNDNMLISDINHNAVSVSYLGISCAYESE